MALYQRNSASFEPIETHPRSVCCTSRCCHGRFVDQRTRALLLRTCRGNMLILKRFSASTEDHLLSKRDDVVPTYQIGNGPRRSFI